MKRVLLLAVLICGFYWKLTLSSQYTWLQSPDLVNQFVPWMTFQATEVQHGRIPLWDPNQWAGQPLLAQALPGTANPLNWILFLLPLRDGALRLIYLHWYFVLIHFLAAWSAYRLARDLGCRPGAAIFGGCVYSLAGWMGAIDWPQMLCGAAPAPLVLMHLLRLWRSDAEWRSGVWGGFFLGLSWLSGHHQVPVFLSLAAALLLVIRRRFVAGLAFFAVALGTGALQILPMVEYARLAVRWVNLDSPVGWGEKVPFEVHNMLRLAPADLLGIVFPGMWKHASPFLGVCSLTFVLLGLALAWRQSSVKVLTLFGLGGLLFATAGYSNWHGLLYSLAPMVDKARNPGHAILLFHLAASALAAIGLDEWLKRADGPWPSRLGRGLLVFAGLVLAVHIATHREGLLAIAMASLSTAGLLVVRLPVQAAVFAIFLFEAAGGNTVVKRSDGLGPYKSTADIAEFLRRQPGRPRVDIDESQLQFNFGDLNGLPQINGFLASATANLHHHALHLAPARNIFSVAFAVRREPTPIFRDLVFSSASGLKVYRNPDAYPRAWAVHEALEMKDRARLPFWLLDSRHDWRRSVFLSGPPPPLVPCSGDESVETTSYQPGEVRIRARLGCRGMVILNDTFYPGWQAKVDGVPATIHEVFGAVRGVVVPGGEHEVVFQFRPLSVYLGAAVSFLTASLVGLLALRRRRA